MNWDRLVGFEAEPHPVLVDFEDFDDDRPVSDYDFLRAFPGES